MDHWWQRHALSSPHAELATHMLRLVKHQAPYMQSSQRMCCSASRLCMPMHTWCCRCCTSANIAAYQCNPPPVPTTITTSPCSHAVTYAQVMRHVFNNREEAAHKGKLARPRMVERYSPTALGKLLALEFDRLKGMLRSGSGLGSWAECWGLRLGGGCDFELPPATASAFQA